MEIMSAGVVSEELNTALMGSTFTLCTHRHSLKTQLEYNKEKYLLTFSSNEAPERSVWKLLMGCFHSDTQTRAHTPDVYTSY